jgi:hypothetical protein
MDHGRGVEVWDVDNQFRFSADRCGFHRAQSSAVIGYSGTGEKFIHIFSFYRQMD